MVLSEFQELASVDGSVVASLGRLSMQDSIYFALMIK
jgi:hypothetical protein